MKKNLKINLLKKCLIASSRPILSTKLTKSRCTKISINFPCSENNFDNIKL